MTGRARRTEAAIAAAAPPLSADLALTAGAMGLRRYARMRRVMGASEALDQMPLVALSGAVLGAGALREDARMRRAGTRMLAGIALASALKGIGKGLVARSRPTELAETGAHRVAVPGEDDGALQAFPSGHTAGAVAVFTPLVRAYPAAAPLAVLAAGGALLKIVRGDHYPSDLLAGALIGAACVGLADGAAGAAERRVAARNRSAASD